MVCFIFLPLAGTAHAAASGTQILTPQVIKKGAAGFLSQRLPWEQESMDVVVSYHGKDMVLPEGNLELRYRLSGGTARLGRIPISLEIRVDGIFKRRLRLTAHVTVIQEVVQTRNSIKRGAILKPADVEIKKIRTDRLVQHVAGNLAEVVGYEARRNLQKGRMVTLNSLRKHPLLKKGDPVVLIAEKGRMRITAPGIAKEKGFKDSMVQVLNVQSKKTVFGWVVDANTVRVNF